MNIQRISHSQHNVHSQAYKPVVWEVPHFPTFPPRTSDVNGGWPWFVSYHKEVGNSSAAQNHGSRNTPSAVHLFPQPSVWPNEKGTWCVAPLSSPPHPTKLGRVGRQSPSVLPSYSCTSSFPSPARCSPGWDEKNRCRPNAPACRLPIPRPWRVTAHQARPITSVSVSVQRF